MRKNKTKTVGLAEDVQEQIKIALDAEMRTAGPQEDYIDPLLACPHCGTREKIVGKKIVNQRFDSTEVYKLACGHTIL
jgi:hypothetical protein